MFKINETISKVWTIPFYGTWENSYLCSSFKIQKIAPLSTLESVWKYHFKKFAPELKVYNLYSLPKRSRKALIKHDDNIHIINYEGFRIHFDDFINANYKCLIIDESSKLKSFKYFSKKAKKEKNQVQVVLRLLKNL